jgi:hypothetical protein
MKLWLILLGVAIGLGIALRRVLRRQSPLNDELYSKQVAVAHVQSGVAWVRADLTFGSVNQSFADTFKMLPRDFVGREWYKVFGAADHARIRESYGQMMLMGMVSFEAPGERADGSFAWLDVRLVAVHDSQMRFVGHHCMIDDKSRERDLEQQVGVLEEHIEQIQRCEQVEHLDQIQRTLECNNARSRTFVPPSDRPAAQPVQAVQLQNVSNASSPSTGPRVESLDALRRATGRSLVSALNSLRKSPTPEQVSPPTGKR